MTKLDAVIQSISGQNVVIAALLAIVGVMGRIIKQLLTIFSNQQSRLMDGMMNNEERVKRIEKLAEKDKEKE